MTKLLNWNGDKSIFDTNKKYIVYANITVTGDVNNDYTYQGFTLLFYYDGYWRIGNTNYPIYEHSSWDIFKWDNISLDFIIECDGDIS